MEMKKASHGTVAKLLDHNNLAYSVVSDTSVAKSRSLIRSNFNKTTYLAPNEQASVFCNFSDAYVNPANSYLKLTVSVEVGKECDSNANVALRHSVLDIFKSVTMTSRSGEVIDRVDELGRRWANMQSWIGTKTSARYADSMMGRSIKVDALTNRSQIVESLVQSTVPVASRTFCVPLRYLLGVFNPHGEKLIPNRLIAGSRLDFSFYDNFTAFQHSVVADESKIQNTYTISDMSLVLDSVVLADGVLSKLNKMMASETGINISFDTWDLTRSTSGSGTSRNVIISAKRALSRVKMGFLMISPVSTARATADVLGQARVDWQNGSFKLGNHRYPEQELNLTQSQMENYVNNLYTFGILSGHSDATIDFAAATETDAGKEKNNPMTCSLESSHLSDLSGVQISNGRSLDFVGTIDQAIAFESYLWTCYTVRLKLFSTKVAVME